MQKQTQKQENAGRKRDMTERIDVRTRMQKCFRKEEGKKYTTKEKRSIKRKK